MKKYIAYSLIVLSGILPTASFLMSKIEKSTRIVTIGKKELQSNFPLNDTERGLVADMLKSNAAVIRRFAETIHHAHLNPTTNTRASYYDTLNTQALEHIDDFEVFLNANPDDLSHFYGQELKNILSVLHSPVTAEDADLTAAVVSFKLSSALVTSMATLICGLFLLLRVQLHEQLDTKNQEIEAVKVLSQLIEESKETLEENRKKVESLQKESLTDEDENDEDDDEIDPLLGSPPDNDYLN